MKGQRDRPPGHGSSVHGLGLSLNPLPEGRSGQHNEGGPSNIHLGALDCLLGLCRVTAYLDNLTGGPR